MTSAQQLEATSSAKKARAEERLNQRVVAGAKQQHDAIQAAMSMVIVDRLYYPEKMEFASAPLSEQQMLLRYKEEDKAYFIHSHALGQMADVAGIARPYVNRLRDGNQWERELLSHNLNELFHKGEFVDARGNKKRYLRRVVGDEVRGFQGRSFGRHLATAPLLRTFVETCGEFQAGPIEAVTTSVRTILKCVTPYIFEPIPGEFVAFGVTFGNSDFGAGTMEVNGTVLRVSSGTISLTENALRRVHLGKAIEAGDNEDIEISDETVTKELETHQSAVRDIVRSQLGVPAIERTLAAIQKAHQNGIEWYRLQSSLQKVLAKKEIEFVRGLVEKGDDLMDLPPLSKDSSGDTVATGWWASNVVGWIASKEEDADRKHALQRLAGKLALGE